ncbi:MAG TPA: nicotinate-nucleotide adenylyltransferase [Pyrinomonadaceae bacterium]|nr:nicotinate-nucleotide adenylyltransferase [Pyrinomonadaceae bacterium]
MKRIAFYGGSFDPPHNGHLTIAERLIEVFALDEFVFVPAFHAPHKKNKNPTAAFHRYTMLSLATNDAPKIKVSRIELEAPEKPYTVETLTRLKNQLKDARIFFVMGADSWDEITTWREWETILTIVNIIVVTRPGYDIEFEHVTSAIRERIVDLRSIGRQTAASSQKNDDSRLTADNSRIYITDAVNLDVSATEIRREIRLKENGWRELLPQEVAKYIEKYEIYK